MVNLMRKYQQTLMLIITILVIIAFAWLYNDYEVGRGRDDEAYARLREVPDGASKRCPGVLVGDPPLQIGGMARS